MSKERNSNTDGKKEIRGAMPDILLIGQPNVGKSVLFSRMTGVRALTSNYPGTTVGYTEGKMRFSTRIYKVVDAPGIYSLEPLDEAARVAIDFIDDAGLIINVLDATHLERHLTLTIELLAQGKPLVVALNMSDEAKHKGIHIDEKKLSKRLGIPVIPTVARTGEGVKQLIQAAVSIDKKTAAAVKDKSSHPWHHPHVARHPQGKITEYHEHLSEKQVWEKVGNIVDEVQTLEHRHHSFGERLEEISVHPLWGGLVASAVLVLSFSLIRIIGEFLIGGGIGLTDKPWIKLPFGTEFFFDGVWKPIMMKLSSLLGEGSFMHKLLIGTLVEGSIDFKQSFGLFTSGFFIPLGAVLPYVFSFYLVMSLLEDSGYLPRLAVFLDNIMHRVGLHGYAIIPTLLGLGCNVPGIMATRILESRRQRFITATLISIAVPCAALQAMIIGLVGDRGVWPVTLIYGILLICWILIGFTLRHTTRGFQPELLIEIPPYRIPDFRAIGAKMWMRIFGFLREALPVVIGAVFAVNILYQANLFERIAKVASPIITKLWGLPEETIVPLLIGILRKDVALGMFAPLDLTTKQLVTGSVVLAMFFPCIATFVILMRELKLKNGLKAIGVMLVAVLLAGITINLVWR